MAGTRICFDMCGLQALEKSGGEGGDSDSSAVLILRNLLNLNEAQNHRNARYAIFWYVLSTRDFRFYFSHFSNASKIAFFSSAPTLAWPNVFTSEIGMSDMVTTSAERN